MLNETSEEANGDIFLKAGLKGQRNRKEGTTFCM